MNIEKKLHSHLIQRLNRPYNPESLAGKHGNPFAFGGGYKNGGLSDEAMDILKDIFSFDYMGAAEYEFGAVPKALSAMFKAGQAGNIVTKEITVKAKPNKYDFSKRFNREGKSDKYNKPAPKACKKTVYVIAPQELLSHAEQVITDCATKDSYNNDIRDNPRLQSALFEEEYIEANNYRNARNVSVGWLELDNGFMFFTDKEMFEKCCKLFEI